MNPTTQQRILFALGLGTAFSLMGDATLYAVLPTHTVEAGITLAVVGLLLGVNRAVRLIFNGLTGWLYDRVSQRGLFILGLGIGAFSTACYAINRGFWVLLVGRVLWGMAWSLIWIGGGTIVLHITAPSERGRLTGFYQTWFFLGGGTGAFLGGILTDLVGYYGMLWIMASIQTISTGIVCVLLPPIPTSDSLKGPEPERNRFFSLFSRDFGLAIGLQGLNRFCISGMLMATLGLLVKERIALPHMLIGAATITGVLIAGRTLVSMAIAPLAGFLSDKTGSRWRILTYALFIGFLAMFLLSLRSSLLIMLGYVCSAVITSTVQSLTITLTGDLVSEAHRGKGVSILHTAGDLGSALGPPCAYGLLLHIGLTGIYLFCAGLFLLACGLVILRQWLSSDRDVRAPRLG